MSDIRCNNCRFWNGAQLMGLCRRYPKTENKHEMDWCGEHQPAAVKMVPVADIQPQVEPKKPGRKPKNVMSDPSA